MKNTLPTLITAIDRVSIRATVADRSKKWFRMLQEIKVFSVLQMSLSVWITAVLMLFTGMANAQDSGVQDTLSQAEKVAQALANPNATLGFLAFPIDYINYRGDLPDADGQNAFKLSFQPSFPYPIAKGTNFFFRPLVPVIFTQPVPVSGGFENRGVELGDISFDAAIGKTWPSKWVTFLGAVSSIPTATDKSLGTGKWLLGPEAFVGRVFKWGFAGILFSQLWSITNNDEGRISTFSGQYFYTVNLPNAWQIQAQPVYSVNWNASAGNKLSLPLGVGVSKTVMMGKLPVRFNLQYWYFIVSPNDFGSRHQVRFQPTPVVPLPW